MIFNITILYQCINANNPFFSIVLFIFGKKKLKDLSVILAITWKELLGNWYQP